MPNGRRTRRRVIIAGSLLIFAAAAAVAVKVIDFGRLTVDLIEKSAHAQIAYSGIQGNIFRGFRLRNYLVRMATPDSAYGEYAEISYRLSFRQLGLPTLFEINLIEPTIIVTQKEGPGTNPREFNLPSLNLGLRINVKNGRVIYNREKTYTLEKISGLIFVDFLGAKFHLGTMNLSLASADFPLVITSLNMAATLSRKNAVVRSFKLKGPGGSIDGQAEFEFATGNFSSIVKKASVDLEVFRIGRGRIDAAGKFAIVDGRIRPELRGEITNLQPVTRAKFETGYIGDTVVINTFDGELYGGSFFAQVKYVDLKTWNLEANVRNVDIGRPLNLPAVLLLNGHLGYQDDRFQGFFSSRGDSGIAVDSLYFFGRRRGTRVGIDSLIIREDGEVLRLEGAVWPQCSLEVAFKSFTIDRGTRFLPVAGTLAGRISLAGDYADLKKMRITADLRARHFALAGIGASEVILAARNAAFEDPASLIDIHAAGITYRNIGLDSLRFSLQAGRFELRLRRSDDSVFLAGRLAEKYRGTVEVARVHYRGLAAVSTMPVAFDAGARKIGRFGFALLGGTLEGTLAPPALELKDIRLDRLGAMTGMKTPVSGTLVCSVRRDSIAVRANAVGFLGLKNGRINITGAYKDRGLTVDSLAIEDDNGQHVFARGFLSQKNSFIDLECRDIGVWIFPMLKGFMQNPQGTISGSAKFAGTFEDFSLAGRGTLDRGSFGLKFIGDEFDSVTADLILAGRTVTFESLRGNVRAASDRKRASVSTVKGGGYIKFEPRFRVRNYNFDFSFPNAPLQILPYAYGKGSGNITVGMKDQVVFYNGNISIKEGVIPVEFGMKVAEETERRNDNYRMNIKITGDRNVWLRNREADIELGGEVYITKEHGPLYFTGTLETRRGNYYWLNHTLEITEGRVNFIPNAEVVDPELDIWAQMNTRERSAETNEEIKIRLHFFGPLSEPVFEFFTEPEGIFTEQDIVTYLNLNISWRELESMKQGEYAVEVLPKSLLALLESDVSRRIRAATGLDYFRINAPLFEADENTKLTVGKYVSRNLFITYTYDITDFANEFNVEYFIDDRNEILVRRDETGEYGMEYQYRIRF